MIWMCQIPTAPTSVCSSHGLVLALGAFLAGQVGQVSLTVLERQ